MASTLSEWVAVPRHFCTFLGPIPTNRTLLCSFCLFFNIKKKGFLHTTFYEKRFLCSYFRCVESWLQHVSSPVVECGDLTLDSMCGLIIEVTSLIVGRRLTFPVPRGILVFSLRIEPKKTDS